MGNSMVSDIHFGHISCALHARIESNVTFHCHILQEPTMTSLSYIHFLPSYKHSRHTVKNMHGVGRTHTNLNFSPE